MARVQHSEPHIRHNFFIKASVMKKIREKAEQYGTMSNYIMQLVENDHRDNLHSDVKKLIKKIDSVLQ